MSDLPRLGSLTPPGALYDLRLRGRQTVIANAPASIDGAVTFSRASAASGFGPSGALLSFAAGAPRYVTDPSPGGRSQGLLMEPAGSNLLLQSNTFSNAAWTRTNMSYLAFAGVGLDGKPGATLVADTTSGIGTIAQSITGLVAGPYAGGAYMRYTGVTQYVRVRWTLTGGSGATGSATFDIVNGLITSYTGATSYRITPGPFGFFRCEILCYNNVSATGMTLQFERANSGDPAGAWHLCEAAIDNATQLTSQISTTTAIAQRSADIATVDLSSVWNPNEGTILVEAFVGGDPTADQTLFIARDAGTANYIQISKSHFGPSIIASSSTGAALTMYGAPQGSLQRIAVGYLAGSWYAAKTGGGGDYTLSTANTPPTATSAVPAGITNWDLGNQGGAAQIGGAVQRLLYFPQRLPNATIAGLVS